MIPMNSHQDWQDEDIRKAYCDEFGNIFINPSKSAPSIKREPEPIKESSWEVTEKERLEALTVAKEKLSEGCNNVRINIYKATKSFVSEGKSQYRFSAKGFVKGLKGASRQSKTGVGALWNFLTQPVWVLQKNKTPKEYSRMTLFSLDVV